MILLSNACSLFYYEKQVALYRIKKGDTLYDISTRFNVTYEQIITENNLSDPNKLFVGQLLEIPYFGQKIAKVSNPRNEAEFDAPPLKSSGMTGKKVSLEGVRKYVRQLYYPVPRNKVRLTSKFGWRWLKFHEGVDFGGKTGTPIYASHTGRVAYSGNKLSGYGNIVIIKGDNILTVYAHNNKNFVRGGDSVTKGQKIAELGASGKVTGPHLHFEVRVKNSYGKYSAVDPLSFLP